MPPIKSKPPCGRIFWAAQAVFVTERNTEGQSDATNSIFLEGVQSIGVSLSSSARSLTDIGRSQRSYTQYNQNNYEITIERKIERGSDFFYKVNNGSYTSYKDSHILSSSNLGFQGLESGGGCLRNYDITIVYRPDNPIITNDEFEDEISVNSRSITYKSCLITNISYSMSVDGGISESISLTTSIMRDEKLGHGSYNIPALASVSEPNVYTLKYSDLDFLLTKSEPFSKLPVEAKSYFDTGGHVYMDKKILAIQSIDISVDINYNTLTDVGIWRGSENGLEYEQNKWKYINLPIDITCSIRGLARQALPFRDLISPKEIIGNVDNIFTTEMGVANGIDWQKTDRIIRIVAKPPGNNQDYFIWDLGTKNYITGIDFSGGDTGGNNVEVTFSYRNDYNDAVFARSNSVIDLTPIEM